MKRILGEFLQALGILIAGLSGLCSGFFLLIFFGQLAADLHSGNFAKTGALLLDTFHNHLYEGIFLGIILTVGLGLFFFGVNLVRSANRDKYGR